MSGVIAVTENAEDMWLFAGWAYGMLIDRLRDSVYLPEDQDRVVRFEVFQNLPLEMLPPEQAARFALALIKLIPALQEELRRPGKRPIDSEFADHLEPVLQCLRAHHPGPPSGP